ncbi:hypothetical protein M8C21_005349, partial [Ambrosia artemisiifolia]
RYDQDDSQKKKTIKLKKKRIYLKIKPSSPSISDHNCHQSSIVIIDIITIPHTKIIVSTEDVEDVLKLSYSHPAAAVKFFRWSGYQFPSAPPLTNLFSVTSSSSYSDLGFAREALEEIKTVQDKDAKQSVALDLISRLNNHWSYSNADYHKGGKMFGLNVKDNIWNVLDLVRGLMRLLPRPSTAEADVTVPFQMVLILNKGASEIVAESHISDIHVVHKYGGQPNIKVTYFRSVLFTVTTLFSQVIHEAGCDCLGYSRAYDEEEADVRLIEISYDNVLYVVLNLLIRKKKFDLLFN